MNMNELTPEEQRVLYAIGAGDGQGHRSSVVAALLRLCLIEKRGPESAPRYVVKPATKKMIGYGLVEEAS